VKQSEQIADLPITNWSREECITAIVEWLKTKDNGRYFVCANPHSLEVARIDKVFEEALRAADLVIPDGVGIVIASWILGGSIRRRVTGSDVFLGLSKLLADDTAQTYRYFFLGSTEETLEKIRQKIKADFPNLVVCGTYSPPFRDEFSEEETRLMIEAVNNAEPDVLWVGMTAPKQEKWIYQNRNRLNVKFIGAIGAVFDFYTGNVKRSHPLFQKLGIEWLPRLLREPRRLWYRNFVSNPSFLLRVIKCRLTGTKKTGDQT
jgi:N-acetylglucosaminyldiphosphoundecaprenol N-acetyl-beta-D-mannosaminyltransferase